MDAYTNLYSPPNRIAILARAISELEYKEGQIIDSYALEVAKAHSRVYAEAARVTPRGRDPVSFARKISKTATFEAGLPPHMRGETIREDATHSFQIARARAKKHEPNTLGGAHIDGGKSVRFESRSRSSSRNSALKNPTQVKRFSSARTSTTVSTESIILEKTASRPRSHKEELATLGM